MSSFLLETVNLYPSFYFCCPECGHGQSVATQFISQFGHQFLQSELKETATGITLQIPEPEECYANDEGVPFLFQVPESVVCEHCAQSFATQIFISDRD